MCVDEFSKRLKELMDLEGISKRSLSLRLGVDRASVRLWLSGRFYPRYDALIKLAAFFKVRIDGLLGLENLLDEHTNIPLTEDFRERAKTQFFTKLNGYVMKNGITRYALAKKLRIDQKALTKWFTSGSMPETATIIRLSQLTATSVDELLGRRK